MTEKIRNNRAGYNKLLQSHSQQLSFFTPAEHWPIKSWVRSTSSQQRHWGFLLLRALHKQPGSEPLTLHAAADTKVGTDCTARQNAAFLLRQFILMAARCVHLGRVAKKPPSAQDLNLASGPCIHFVLVPDTAVLGHWGHLRLPEAFHHPHGDKLNIFGNLAFNLPLLQFSLLFLLPFCV